jgi:amino acid adenylation domain-containing protein/non-ribosomal peptide synthase protein (TIGR01720 family)
MSTSENQPAGTAGIDAKRLQLLAARARERGLDPRQLPIAPQARSGGRSPLSFAQERLWVVDRLEPGSPAYNEPYRARLAGPLSPAVLAASLSEIVHRHEILRSTFPEEAEPVQVAGPPRPLPLPLVDLGGLAAPGRAAEAERLSRREAEIPFDLAAGPIVRAALIRLAGEDHLLLLTLHHIACDAASISLLSAELDALYESAAAGSVTPLSPPPLQYADFAVWQRAWLADQTLDKLVAHWRERMRGAPSLLELPLDRPRPERMSFAGAELPLRLGGALTSRLRELARRNGATLFMLLLAAFDTLLARLSGQLDIVVGSPVSGRDRTELGGVIGFFVNTIALRTDLAGDPAFAAVVQRVRETALAAFDHQDLPFARLVEEVQPARSPAYAPLVQVVFMLQRAAAAAPRRFVLRPLDNGTAKFDLTFKLIEGKQEVTGVVEHSASLFARTTIARWVEHWATLLEAVAERPEQPLSALPLLGPAQRDQLLVEWNDQACEPLADLCVHQLVARAAARWPERCAVEWEGTALTYGELDRRVRRLAARLRKLGAGPEVAVGLCAERSPDLVVGLLAILQAGGCYLPLDPEYPQERLAYMLADSAVPVVLTQGRLLPWLPASIRRVDLDAPEEAEGGGDEPEEAAAADPSNLAYVIYTSGSTGRPKGTLVAHRGVVNMLRWRQRRYPLGPDDRVLQTDSFSFDASVWQFLWPLSAGARLVLTRSGGHRDSGYLVDLLARRDITVVGLVPSMLQVVVQEPGLAHCRALRHVFCGGEALHFDLVRRLCGRLPGLELHNVYGPTEATIDTTDATYRGDETGLPGRVAPIGRPLAHQRVHVLDSDAEPVPPGVAGELYIGGVGLARGYHRQPRPTAERFLPDAVSGIPGERLYRTGDRVRWLADGRLDFLGRLDHQVKMRGFRIELQEIEAALARHPAVAEGVVTAAADAAAAGAGAVRLVAYFAAAPGQPAPTAEALRAFLRASLPEHMVPAAFVGLPALPLTPSGKVDRRALPEPTAGQLLAAASSAPPRTELERRLAELWREILGREQIGRDDHFFDLGGHSLLLIRFQSRLREALGHDVPLVELFRHTTVRALAEHLAAPATATDATAAASPRPSGDGGRPEVAIVGMSGRFPGAGNVEALWSNLRNGVDSVTFFSDEELLAEGVSPEQLRHPGYVRARAVIEGYDRFAAGFFDMSPREAQALDPQHRLFLECAWEAIEDAGYDVGQLGGAVGVFAGVGMNGYLLHEVVRDRALIEALGGFRTMLGNDKDFLPTRVSYKLDLRGPSILVQTACSTSLVAVHLACRSLAAGECDMALAGGVTIAVPHRHGYLYQEGAIYAPDGHCRAFDAGAKGTLPASGVGIVVLKRLADARADGDTIYAVIKGSAINNDGGRKIGYSAPSLNGQADVLRAALAEAGVGAETISYIEAHGTGTVLGDLVEITAIKEAYAPLAEKQGRCGLGSLKTNFGHLDTAAGVGSLIKTSLALHHRELPPSLHFERPNPQLRLEGSPFFVNAHLAPWTTDGGPRRAGVSSFGIGGTNAHVILEEAPAAEASAAAPGLEIVVLSAKTETALERAAANLADYLERHPDLPLAAVASTLQLGRRPFPRRRVAIAADLPQMVRRLRAGDSTGALSSFAVPGAEGPVTFLFPGVGAQHTGMTREVYAREPLFRTHLDACAELLHPHLGLDLRDVLYAPPERAAEATLRLRRTDVGMPALFSVEYACAQLWMGWGIRPQAMIGHSLGEYAAACLAGVLTLPDALALVARRGRLLDTLPPGAMLGVPLEESALLPRLQGGLAIAAVNLPGYCVVSGPRDAVAELERTLAQEGIEGRRIATETALHSPLVDPILDELESFVATLSLAPPTIPYVSSLTGTWITAREAMDPHYWRRHLRQPVRFSDGIRELFKPAERILLEVGPGRTLATLARRHPGRPAGQLVLHSLRHPNEEEGESEVLLRALGHLWLAGTEIDWRAFHGTRPIRRLSLPTYPFERQRYWTDGATGAAASETAAAAGEASAASWLYVPAWERVPLPPVVAPREVGGKKDQVGGPWLMFAGRAPLAAALAREIGAAGFEVVLVRPGEECGWNGEVFVLRPDEPGDYYALLDALDRSGKRPGRVIHAWGLEPAAGRDDADLLALGFDSLLHLDRALAESAGTAALSIDLLLSEAQEVTGGELVVPAKAAALGWCEELPGHSPARLVRALDVAVPATEGEGEKQLALHLARDLAQPVREPWVAYRGGLRWIRRLREVRPVDAPAASLAGEPDIVVIADHGDGLGPKMAALLARVNVRAALAPPTATPEQPGLRLTFRPLAAVIGPGSTPAARAASHRAHAAALLSRGSRTSWRELIWDETLFPPDLLEAGEEAGSAGSASGEQAVRRALDAFGRALALSEEVRVLISNRAPAAWLAAPPAAPTRPAEDGATAAASIHSRPPLAAPYEAPRNDLERTLVRIWEEVLGVSPIGIHDPFNALGGDSLLAIQTVAKAQALGIMFGPRKVYLNPTVADLTLAVAIDAASGAKQGVLAGEVQLSPIQRWFFEDLQPPDPQHWNVDLLLATRGDVEPRRLEAVLSYLPLHHDALRLRFTAAPLGWQQWYGEPDPAPFFHRIDHGALPAEQQERALDAAAGQLQRSLDLGTGPLLRAAFFDRGRGRGGRLLLIFHHLVADSISLRIMVEDLDAWYQELERTGTLAPAAKTTSFDHWALRINELGRSRENAAQMEYWLTADRKTVSRLPVDLPGGKSTMGSLARVSRSLTAQQTAALLEDLPQALDAGVAGILLTALVRAGERWTGDRALLVDVESHGREPIFRDVDLSRTVGWFNCVFPLLLDLRGTPPDPLAELHQVRDQLRAVPNQGVRYGLLRYLDHSAETRKRIRAMPAAEVIFRYLSPAEQPPAETARLRLTAESRGPAVSPRAIQGHLLAVGARVLDGQMHLTFEYSRNLYRASTVEAIASAFQEALAGLLDSATAALAAVGAAQ